MIGWWRRRGPVEWPTGHLAEVVQQAALHAEQMQAEFERHHRLVGVEVSVSLVRAKRQEATKVHMGAFLLRYSAGREVEVLDHAELMLCKPDQRHPWRQLLTPEQARDGVRRALEQWAGANI